ncbi:MAG: hypothetical protein HYZ54_08085 [Ignavibacteriae bacterium]|nr:hypothetical protein [Ignavibacteriota bacterium]
MIRSLLAAVFFFICSIISPVKSLSADKCSDRLLLDGADSVMVYGMDTTNHWWAITKPFTGKYRLFVDGKQTANVYEQFRPPVFSPDGEHWAAYGYRTTGWEVITDDTVIYTNASSVGDIVFGQSSAMAYSFFDGDIETIVLGNKRYFAQDRRSKIYISNDGSVVSYVCSRLGVEFLRTNGQDETQFDEIKLAGIWNDNQPFYTGKQGVLWKIYKGSDEMSSGYESITEMVLNPQGTNGAAICNGQQSAQVFLYSDEYYEPLESKRYDRVEQLVLHPTLPMVGFKGVVNNVANIVLNRTEYDAGKEAGAPFFTYDGSEFIYFGFDVDFFISVNGKKYVQESNLSLSQLFAVMPGNKTFAYSTNSAMVVHEMEKNFSYSGRMFDQAIAPRYNRRTERYETLALIGTRLIMLACKMK